MNCREFVNLHISCVVLASNWSDDTVQIKNHKLTEIGNKRKETFKKVSNEEQLW
jgi:hypothetical protein